MPNIQTNNDLPGILNLMKFCPTAAKPLNALAEAILRAEPAPGSLSRAEREIIFSVVSMVNHCEFCADVHAQCAIVEARKENLFKDEPELVMKLINDHGPCGADRVISDKLHSLLHLAIDVAIGHDPKGDFRTSASEVTKSARATGATDLEIHDTVLIAAMAAMFNRYVDGLGTSIPENKGFYVEAAEMLTSKGYTNSVS